MKATKITSLLVLALAITLVGTGCQKRPGVVTPLRKSDTIVRPYDGMNGLPQVNPGDNPDSRNGGIPQDPKDFIKSGNYDVDSAALSAHAVHFDYDSSVIKGSEKGNVEAVASYMKSNSGVGLRIDGHCDERGTEDYNNSLGERRALALRDAVLGFGVEADRVITQTFGENKPVDPGQNEEAYRKNRRGEFMVLHPK